MANATTDTTTETQTPLTEAETTASEIISLEVPSAGALDSTPTLQVAPNGGTQLAGTDNQDILVGAAGNDNLAGEEGDDVLVGGSGRNVLEGGDGNDIFGHTAGAVDIIADFSATQNEKIALADGLSVSTSTQQTITADLGEGAATHDALVLTLSDNSVIALIGVTDEFSTDWLTSTV